MKASTKRALSLLLTAIFIVTSLVIYVSLILPEYENVKTLRGQLTSKTNLYNNEQRAITQVQNLIAQYQGSARLGDQLSLVLPSEEAVSSIMSQLNAISQLNSIKIQGVGIEYLPIKPAATSLTSAHGIGTLRLDLKLAGTYASFKAFLSDMEKNVRVMDTKLLQIDKTGNDNDDSYLFSLNVDTYYQSSK